ncbi:MAG: hypothetical protein ACTHON_18965 [Humibacter sp.]
MDTAIFVTMLLTLIVVAAIVFTLPSLMPRTVPLGVNVPLARIDEPIIRTSLRRFRLLVAASWLLAVILLVILVYFAPLAAALVSMLLFTAGSTVAYIVARQGIVRAKHEGEWYSGATVRLAGDVTAEPVRTPIPVGWFAVSMLLLGLVTVIGAAVYPTLPASIPCTGTRAGSQTAMSRRACGRSSGSSSSSRSWSSGSSPSRSPAVSSRSGRFRRQAPSRMPPVSAASGRSCRRFWAG